MGGVTHFTSTNSQSAIPTANSHVQRVNYTFGEISITKINQKPAKHASTTVMYFIPVKT